LVEALSEGIPNILAARAAHFDVALFTLGYRELERDSREARADKQRYLTRYEANAIAHGQAHTLKFALRLLRPIHE
jgi:hypothetical protein